MASGGPSTLFEELGFFYVGPVDAHDLDLLLPVLENIRDNVPDTKPVLLHIKSIKGKGKQLIYNKPETTGQGGQIVQFRFVIYPLHFYTTHASAPMCLTMHRISPSRGCI